MSLPAPEYILTLLEWTADIIADESIFPVTEDIPFPKNFKKVCSKILRRLYRIFVHVYIEHFDRFILQCTVHHILFFPGWKAWQ